MAIDREKWERIMEEAEFPENYGERGNISGESMNAGCGDWVKITMGLENGRIVEAGFLHRGCMVSKAAASILTKMMKGKTLEEARKIGFSDLMEMMGDAVKTRIKCAMTAYNAMMNCIGNAERY